MGIVTWGALASGFLSGKYKPGERIVPGTRSEEKWNWHGRFFAPNADETLVTLLDVAKEHPTQVALRWSLDQPGSLLLLSAYVMLTVKNNVGDWLATEASS
jgi:aryl-alcohol dehydrogenase-like predicted oxidoreductase